MIIDQSWRLVGRVLISLILFTAALEKLQYSSIYRHSFSTYLEHVQAITAQVGLSLPDVSIR